ncbi:transporter [Streptomyces sp. ET3-23]|uniref:carbonic anhydrase n=1 Tax=Streptomyces sp. ET3-23 TaxID=2885643 RepID=UPI001D11AEBF|nr:carbonic anhydrase [Streptomyces sp. ET3-23]MCC2274723.1 transporter [Streptomyces sp. ET3-23]
MHAQPIPASPPPPDPSRNRRSEPVGPARPSTSRLRRELRTSVTVSLVALPLSLGIALASGAPLQAGLVAVAVGAVVSVVLGGAPPLVGGAATGLVVVTAELVQRYGWRVTCAITALAGLTQLALGAARVGRLVLAAGPAAVHGLLAGVGAAIAFGQAPVLLGGTPGGPFPESLGALPSQLAHPRPEALLVGILTAAVTVCWGRVPGRAGRWLHRVPAPFAALAAATAAGAATALPRVTFSPWELRAPAPLPHSPVLGVFAAVLTVALVAGMESLPAAMDLRRIRTQQPTAQGQERADGAADGPDRELAGQGLATLVSGLLGGLPVARGTRPAADEDTAMPTGSTKSRLPQGAWILACAGALVLAVALRLVPLVALSSLVLVAGVRMAVSAHRGLMPHGWREFAVYGATCGSVTMLGVLQGLAVGLGVTVLLSLGRISRLARAKAYEVVRAGSGRTAGTTAIGGAEASGTAGSGMPVDSHVCHPWTPWRNHHCTHPRTTAGPPGPVSGRQLLGGVSAFQRNTAPRVRDELARLAREGQCPGHLFLTCADSRLVTSMITSSGPGDLFTVRNVGNLMPPPGNDGTCDSVGAAVEYAVDVLRVGTITVCGHSGCGAMQALLNSAASPGPQPGSAAETSLGRWLRHGRPSLARMQRIGRLGRGEVALDDRPVADDGERLALVNVMQQLDHLMAHACVARRVAEGSLHLQGLYFDVARAQAYVLDQRSHTFSAVRPEVLDAVQPL